MEKAVHADMTGRIASLYVFYLVCLSHAGELLTGINTLFFLVPLMGVAFLVLGKSLGFTAFAKYSVQETQLSGTTRA